MITALSRKFFCTHFNPENTVVQLIYGRPEKRGSFSLAWRRLMRPAPGLSVGHSRQRGRAAHIRRFSFPAAMRAASACAGCPATKRNAQEPGSTRAPIGYYLRARMPGCARPLNFSPDPLLGVPRSHLAA